MENIQNWPLTFDLHLDGLHRYDPQSIIKILIQRIGSYEMVNSITEMW